MLIVKRSRFKAAQGEIIFVVFYLCLTFNSSEGQEM